MIDPASINPNDAETAGEQLVHRLILQGERDGQAGSPMRSEHPAYGNAYWAESRLRLAEAGTHLISVQRGTLREVDGSLSACYFVIGPADAHDSFARLERAADVGRMVRDSGARVIDAEGQDVTLFSTRLQ